jgi:hypothetical protein
LFNRIIEIDVNRGEWDEEDQQIQSTNSIKKFDSKSVTNLSLTDRQITSGLTHPTDRLSLYSPSSYTSSTTTTTNSLNNENRPNSSTSKRSSNLKKSDQSSSNRVKSPKSVTFNIEQNKELTKPIIEKQQTIVESIEKTLNETITSNSNEILRQNSDLIPDLFKQHHNEVTNKPNIGYKLGKYVGNLLTNIIYFLYLKLVH